MQSFLERWRGYYLLAAVGLTLFFGYHCLHLRVDEDNRSMDAENEEQSRIEDEFNELFDGGDPILVAVHRESGILNDTGQKLVREMGDEFSEIKGIKEVRSLADDDFDFFDYMEGLLISEDRKTTGIQIQPEEFDDNGESITRVIQEIRAIAIKRSVKDTKIAVTGLPIQKYEAGKLVRRDERIFAPLAFIILGIVLLLITKRWSGMVFPLLVSGLTICWTLGIYSLLGYSLNMITSLLAPVIMTLSVTTTIHIYLEWLSCRERNRLERILAAVKSLYRPCLFASLTTAIGFLSLLLSNTPAVREFGMFAALGVGISYIMGVTGLAVGLSFVKLPLPKNIKRRDKAGALGLVLDGVSGFSIRHPRKLIIGTILVAAISVYGLRKVRSNTDILRYLGTKTELYKDTMFIDEHLTGVNAIDLSISKSNGEAIDSFDDLETIGVFEDALLENDLVKHSLSLVSLFDNEEVEEARDLLTFEEIVEEAGVTEFLSEDLKTARMSIRTKAIGTHAGAELIDAIRSVASENLGEEYVVQEIGGFYRVISESNLLVSTQIKSFSIAIVLILIAIGIVFRSFYFMGLAIIPNVIPLLMTAAMMGFFKIDLSTGTTMIASVVIGVAVDDTIHYLAAFKRANQGDCDQALKKTTRLTGFALVSTTSALSFGFWTAIFGSFQPTVYFALLSGITMWFALACDLLVLPACLKLAFSKRKKEITNG